MLSCGLPRGPGHYVSLGGFEGKGQGGQAVGHEVDPEDMDRQEGNREAHEGREKERPVFRPNWW